MATTDQPHTWSFLTSQARVLFIVATDPAVRVRDIASSCGITERHVQSLIADLEGAVASARSTSSRPPCRRWSRTASDATLGFTWQVLRFSG